MKRCAVLTLIAALSLTAGASASELAVYEQPNLEQTLYVVPKRVCAEAPISEYEPCSYRLQMQKWDRESQSMVTVFSREGRSREARIAMPWRCGLNGAKLYYTLEVWVPGEGQWVPGEAGTEVWIEGPPIWQFEERGTESVWISACVDLSVPEHTIRISRRQAERAVLHRLRGFFVSALGCKKRHRVFVCRTTFNNTYRICRAKFRTRGFAVGNTEGDVRRGIAVERLNRRCAPLF